MLVTAVCTALCLMTAPDTVEGTWEGRIEVVGQKIPLTVYFVEEAEGLRATVDIQGLTGHQLEAVVYEAPQVRFRLAAAAPAEFDGTHEGEEITGSFHQGTVTGTFELKRTLKGKPMGMLEEEVPYRQEEVVLESGAVRLAGTLTLPEGEGPFPGVILITGSGAQNRDEEVVGFRPFRVLADHLTRAGLAVLRCDDRGVGGSTGTLANATVEDLVGDVIAQLDHLSGHAEVDGKRLALLGHSEGGLLAPMVAKRREDVRALVLVAGPAVNGADILREQKRLILLSQLAPPERIAFGTKVQDALFRAVKTNQGWQEATALVRQELTEAGTPRKSIEAMVQSTLLGVQQPMMRFFLEHDPAVDLRQVACPVLALYGEHDLQVAARQNAPVLEELWKGHPDATVRVLSKANHLFQESRNGSPVEYATLKKEFVEGFLEEIAAFLKGRL